jgi:hypothetical protein
MAYVVALAFILAQYRAAERKGITEKNAKPKKCRCTEVNIGCITNSKRWRITIRD